MKVLKICMSILTYCMISLGIITVLYFVQHSFRDDKLNLSIREKEWLIIYEHGWVRARHSKNISFNQKEWEK